MLKLDDGQDGGRVILLGAPGNEPQLDILFPKSTISTANDSTANGYNALLLGYRRVQYRIGSQAGDNITHWGNTNSLLE